MAAITQKTNTIGVAADNEYALIRSESAGKTDYVQIDGLRASRMHWFLGVVMFDVSGNEIVDVAGSFAVQVKPWTTMQYDAPLVATIDAKTPVQVDWAAPTVGIKVTPTGLTNTVTWEVRIAAARS